LQAIEAKVFPGINLFLRMDSKAVNPLARVVFRDGTGAGADTFAGDF
jgi:hypothetical protein